MDLTKLRFNYKIVCLFQGNHVLQVSFPFAIVVVKLVKCVCVNVFSLLLLQGSLVVCALNTQHSSFICKNNSLYGALSAWLGVDCACLFVWQTLQFCCSCNHCGSTKHSPSLRQMSTFRLILSLFGFLKKL